MSQLLDCAYRFNLQMMGVGILNFSAWFMKNVLFKQKKHKIMM